MCRKYQDILRVTFLAKTFQYLQPVMISHTTILKKLFFGVYFCDFDFSFIFTKKEWFFCALCGNIAAFWSISLKKITQNPLWKWQVRPKFINVIMENTRSHKSGANSTLYNLAITGLPLSSRIFIWTSHVCFAVTKCISLTSVYFSVSTNKPSIKSEITGVLWQVTPQSKIQLMAPQSPVGMGAGLGSGTGNWAGRLKWTSG